MQLSPANHVLTPHCALSTVFMTTAAAVFGLALACSTYFARLGLRLPSVLYEGRCVAMVELAESARMGTGSLMLVRVTGSVCLGFVAQAFVDCSTGGVGMGCGGRLAGCVGAGQ